VREEIQAMLIKAETLSSDALGRVIAKLPEGWARQKYEALLTEKTATETPALYHLDELLRIGNCSPADLREIHLTKLAYPGSRIIQDG
jgi:hypothetical protein